MIEHKYGEYPDDQFKEYCTRLHSRIHLLLIYAETNPELLKTYFDVVQREFAGLNSLLNAPAKLVEIMVMIEAAKIEFNSPTYTHGAYRKLILELHSLIDQIPEVHPYG